MSILLALLMVAFQIIGPSVTASNASASAGTAATPTFVASNGSTFYESQNITISSTTSGASIYYTTDGTTPTTGSSAYSTAVPVTVTSTVKAIAVKSGYTNSSVGSASYTQSAKLGWWKMNEDTGVTFNDSSGNGYTATGGTIPSAWSTISGYAVNPVPIFPGTTTGPVTSVYAPFEFLPTTAFSVSIWGASVTGLGTFVGNLNSSGVSGWEVIWNSSGSDIIFQFVDASNNQRRVIVTNPATSTVHHYVVTNDGTGTQAGMKFYLDGVNSGSNSTNTFSGSAATTTPLQFGSRPTGSHILDGSISDCRMYSGVLTQQDVTALFSAGNI